MEAEKLVVTKEVLVVEKLVDVVALTTCNTVPALAVESNVPVFSGKVSV